MTVTHTKFHEILTVAPVGFNVYFVNRGFWVDKPSSCNVAANANVAAKEIMYLMKCFILAVDKI